MSETYRLKVLLTISVFLLFALIINMFSFPLTGKATTADVSTEATILIYMAIEASTNMTSEGIKFNISVLPAINANSTGSYGDPGTAYENMTLQNISVSSDTSTNIDLCVKANANLTSGGNVITIDNYKWANSTGNNITDPDIGFQRPFNTSFDKSITNIVPGAATHYRFWLNVSGGQAPGIYNNTINFKAIQNTYGCG
jgi:hypothetical protein